MTYGEFHLVFTIPQTILLMLASYYFSDRKIFKQCFYAQVLLAVLALVYTTPWDNYLVYKNIWWYGPDRVMGVLGYVPIEEYFFFIIQCFFTGSILNFLMKKLSLKPIDPNRHGKFLNYLTYLLFIIGLISLNFDRSLYLGLILSWACPILLIQQFFGKDILSANRKLYFLAVSIPSLYLGIADAYAIESKIWSLSAKYTLGIKFFNVLPLEEFLFFVFTNLMLVQGLILFLHPLSLTRVKVLLQKKEAAT